MHHRIVNRQKELHKRIIEKKLELVFSQFDKTARKHYNN